MFVWGLCQCDIKFIQIVGFMAFYGGGDGVAGGNLVGFELIKLLVMWPHIRRYGHLTMSLSKHLYY